LIDKQTENENETTIEERKGRGKEMVHHSSQF
jgi:hypothetical protein